MLNQDICTLYDSIAVYAEYGGIVFAEEEGRNIARALGPKNKVCSLHRLYLFHDECAADDVPRPPYCSTTASSPRAQQSTKQASCLACSIAAVLSSCRSKQLCMATRH